MILQTIGYALMIAIVFSLLFAFVFRIRGPWDNFWVMLLIIFLGVWALSLWIEPIGPTWQGLAWLDLPIFGLLIAMMMAAAGEAADRKLRPYRDREVDLVKEAKADLVATSLFGIFFWIFLLALLLAAVIGLLSGTEVI